MNCTVCTPKEKNDLLEKSLQIFLKEWREEHHVHENYNEGIGHGDDKQNSDKYYDWGGLLGFIGLIEAGFMPAS